MCSCGTNCGGKCSSCASNNNFGWGSCSCGDSCTFSCFAACRNDCTGSCSGSCSGTCTSGCKDNCGTGCNIGCTNTEAVDLYNVLSSGLNEKIASADMQNVQDILLKEAARRSKTITEITFDEKITSANISQLQTNVTTLGFSAEGNAGVGEPISKALHENILNAAMDAYEAPLYSSATGK